MAEARDEHSEAQKPVIEVITTVSERVNRRIVEHRPAYYGSDGEVSYDEDDSGVNTKESTRTEIFVHSKHLSKWLKERVSHLHRRCRDSVPGINVNDDYGSLEAGRSSLTLTQQSSLFPHVHQPKLQLNKPLINYQSMR